MLISYSIARVPRHDFSPALYYFHFLQYINFLQYSVRSALAQTRPWQRWRAGWSQHEHSTGHRSREPSRAGGITLRLYLLCRLNRSFSGHVSLHLVSSVVLLSSIAEMLDLLFCQDEAHSVDPAYRLRWMKRAAWVPICNY